MRLAARHWRRLAFAAAALLMGMSCTISQAQDEVARVRQWQKRLDASFASIDERWRVAQQRGIAMLALPAYRSLEEIKPAEYELEEYRAFDIADVTQMNELGSELAAILRVPAPPGFRDEPLLNIVSLRPHIQHDPPPFGLNYLSMVDDGAAFVTHRLLLEDWLRWKRSRYQEPVRTLKAALDSGVLYRSVFDLGKVAVRLPVQVPLQSIGAAALLVRWDERAGIESPPKDLVVALLRNDRMVMVRMQIKTQLPAVPSCSASAKRLTAKRLYVDAQRVFMTCYTHAVAHRPELEQATQEAQALLDRLPATLVNR